MDHAPRGTGLGRGLGGGGQGVHPRAQPTAAGQRPPCAHPPLHAGTWAAAASSAGNPDSYVKSRNFSNDGNEFACFFNPRLGQTKHTWLRDSAHEGAVLWRPALKFTGDVRSVRLKGRPIGVKVSVQSEKDPMCPSPRCQPSPTGVEAACRLLLGHVVSHVHRGQRCRPLKKRWT